MSEGFFRMFSWLGYSFISWASWSTAPVVQSPSLPGSLAVNTLCLSPRAHSSDTSVLCASLCCSADGGHSSSLQSSHPRASQAHLQLRLSRESWVMHILLPRCPHQIKQLRAARELGPCFSLCIHILSIALHICTQSELAHSSGVIPAPARAEGAHATEVKLTKARTELKMFGVVFFFFH